MKKILLIICVIGVSQSFAQTEVTQPAQAKAALVESAPKTFSVGNKGVVSGTQAPSATQEVFTPIPTTEYTDPNYQTNLEKSAALSNSIQTTPAVTETKEEKIERLTKELANHPIESETYLHIKQKIQHLQSDITND